MAKPRVFVSSTYYDLKHLRSSLENFIESLGFEPILSEKGDIAYSPDIPLDESCYKEASNADIFVLIIGGRYGSEASSEGKGPNKSFFDRYNSITKQEYRHAIERDVPTYILIDNNVYAEYRTFLKNKSKKDIEYAHVDSVNIFLLIEDILCQPKNNPVFPFEKFSEIEGWLREQWSGLFKELLRRMTQQQQITSLSSKVAELGEINVTLRRYMETIIAKVSPEESDDIIESEAKRLKEAQQISEFKRNRLVDFLMTVLGIPMEDCVHALRSANSFDEVADLLAAGLSPNVKELAEGARGVLRESERARIDFNDARNILGKPPIREKGSGRGKKK